MSVLLNTDYPGNAVPENIEGDTNFNTLEIPPQQNPGVSTFSVPTVIVDLPSKGLIYSADHPLRSGVIEIKYMTAKEEDILSNESFIKNGTVIDRFLQSIIVTPGVVIGDMLLGDIDALTVAARIYGFGAEYEINVQTPSGNKQKVFVDLTKLMHNTLDNYLVKKNGVNEFEFKAPSGVVLTFKLLTQKDQQAIQNDLKKVARLSGGQGAGTVSTQLRHQIIAVNGDYNKLNIGNFIDNYFLGSDSRAFRKYVQAIQPGIDLSMEVTDEITGEQFQTNVTFGLGFFWPDATIPD